MPTEEYVMNGKRLSFETRPGVFAQYGLDKGSKLLLEYVDFPSRSKVLDLGCGCGFLGIAAASVSPEQSVFLVDSDIRAVNLAKENAKRNELNNVTVLLSDVTSGLPADVKFDVVISNPPTHQGREVVVQFIQEAHKVLKTGGVAYFVVNRMASVLDRMKEVFGNSEKIGRREGYIVFKAVKN